MNHTEKAVGRVLILTGEGKGKTSSAIGTALRAIGHGMRVLMIQFIKADRCGEHKALEEFRERFDVRIAGTGFLSTDNPDGLKNAAEKARSVLVEARKAMQTGAYDLVILDEVIYALHWGLLESDEIRAAVRARAPGVHVILTGRGPWAEVADLSDTITQMMCQKHAYNEGIPATKGIEY